MKLFGTVDKTQGTKQKVEKINKDLQTIERQRQVKRIELAKETNQHKLEVAKLELESQKTLAALELESLNVEQDIRNKKVRQIEESKALPKIAEELVDVQADVRELTEKLSGLVDLSQSLINSVQSQLQEASVLRDKCKDELEHAGKLNECASESYSAGSKELVEIQSQRREIESELETIEGVREVLVGEIARQEIDLGRKTLWLEEARAELDEEKKVIHRQRAKLKKQKELYDKSGRK